MAPNRIREILTQRLAQLLPDPLEFVHAHSRIRYLCIFRIVYLTATPGKREKGSGNANDNHWESVSGLRRRSRLLCGEPYHDLASREGWSSPGVWPGIGRTISPR